MEQINPIMLNPVQRYLATLNRLAELAEEDEELPAAETVIHLNSMLTACDQLIRENNLLQAQVLSADKLIEEQEIEIAIKDLEIFNFDNQIPENEEE